MPAAKAPGRAPGAKSLALVEDDDDGTLAVVPPQRAAYPGAYTPDGKPTGARPIEGTGYGYEPDFGAATYYSFFGPSEKFTPKVEPDGSYMHDQRQEPERTPEELKELKRKAWERGVPISMQESVLSAAERFMDDEKISLVVVSEMHKDEEYGIERREDGGHCGGPFRLKVSPKCTVRDLHLLIRDAAGIMPGLQKLAYRGVALDDPYRRLEQYGVAHWHAKFPDWPVVVKQ